MSTADNQKCKDRVRAEYRKTIDDLQEVWYAETHPQEPCRVCKGTGKVPSKTVSGREYACSYCDGGTYPEDGRLNEYGLSFDYVAPGTFRDQRRGYWRYQLSWGGPSDEFRFYCDERKQPTRIEYWFMDWFDGAKISIKPDSEDWNLLLDLWTWFDDVGAVDEQFRKGMEQ